MENNKISRALSATVLITLSLLLTVFTVAYWAGEVKGNQADAGSNTIEIGTAKSAETTVVVSNVGNGSSTTLVPVGRTATVATATDNVILQFKVKWTSNEAGAAKGTKGRLEVINTENLIGGVETLLINTEVQGQHIAITADGEEVLVQVKVTLTEPKDKDEYEAIAGGKLETLFKFTVVPE